MCSEITRGRVLNGDRTLYAQRTVLVPMNNN